MLNPTPLLVGGVWVLLAAASAAQAPLSQVDTHVATARTAAGQEYRATFVNLCLPAAPRGGGPGAGAAGRGGGRRVAGWSRRGRRRRRRARCRRAGDTGPGGLVRVAFQSLRQPLLARHAPALVMGIGH